VSRKCVIGVDLGTTGTKTGIFDSTGRLISEAYEESRLYYPKPSWVEQDMMEIYESAVRTIRQAMRDGGVSPGEVEAIAFDGQMSGIGAIDEEFNPVTRYDSWLDTRCCCYVNLMREAAEREILESSGCPPTFAHGPKILWWMNEQPEVFKKIHKFVVPAGFVAGRMAGLDGDSAFIDYTYIHFSGFSDVVGANWSERLCETFRVPMEKLPRIVNPSDIVGALTKEAAAECGLREGLPIAAGAGDQTAGYLGAGIVVPGIILDNAGTASVMASCTDTFKPDIANETVIMSRSVIPGLWHPLAFISGGGLCLRWFRDEFSADITRGERKNGVDDAYRLLDESAAGIEPGSGNMLFVPHLGGRVLPSDPVVRGAWVGFSWGQGRPAFFRSILEAIAYEYQYYLDVKRKLFPNVDFNEVRVIGGGAKSGLWNQIKADVLGISYTRLERTEVAILGSAMIAGHAVGLFKDMVETSMRIVKTVGRVEPRPEYHEKYMRYAHLYRELFPSLAKVYGELAELAET